MHVQYSFAAQPWLETLSTCAPGNIIAADLTAADFQDPQTVDMVMRLGQPTTLNGSAFQIGTDDLLVIVSRQNPISQLSLEQVRGLFSGQIQTWKTINQSDKPVQVWIFPNGEDVQQIFEQTILDGSPLASTARLAASPEQMSQAVAADVNAVGILTRRWQAGNTTDVFTAAGSLPVLAITRSTPEAPLSQILTCLQK